MVGGFAEPTIRRIPDPVIRAAALVDPFAREFLEMRYQFERPFVLDSTRTVEAFGLRHQDVTGALRAALSGDAPS